MWPEYEPTILFRTIADVGNLQQLGGSPCRIIPTFNS
jgi:hypothetical protein